MPSPAAFTRTLERSGSRLMIRSVCARCGDSKLVSKHDSSLQNWEDGHRCKITVEKKKGPASAAIRQVLRLHKGAGGTSERDPRKIS